MKHGHATRNSGLSKTYNAWAGMKQRCSNPEHPRYADYGGRGISYPAEWEEFEIFLNAMGPCPFKHVLDRTDNEKNYSEENCRWVNESQSVFNRRQFKNNTSGVTGVSRYRDKWLAKFGRVRLGLFLTKEEAVAARKKAEASQCTTN